MWDRVRSNQHAPTTCSVEKTVAYFAAVAGETDLPFFAYWLGSTINQRFGNEL